MKNKKIIIAGGSGFIGGALTAAFGEDNEIVILGRQVSSSNNSYKDVVDPTSSNINARFVKWNGKDVNDEWAKEIDGADVVINLAGKSVNCRYHAKQKKEIIDSRVNSTAAIGEAIRKAAHPPAVWINSASTTIYRNTYGEPNDEFTGVISDQKKDNMPSNIIDSLRTKKNKILARFRHGKNSKEYKELDLDFSVHVCKLWEEEFNRQLTPGTKKVTLRTAIVIGEGGVIIPFLNICKFGAGGRQGSGRQFLTWVHMDDVAGMIEWIVDNNKEGIYNCAAPNAVTNKDFMKTLRKVTGHFVGLPTPAVLLEFGTWMIGSESELILKSRRVYPARAINEGYSFKYAELETALRSVIDELPRKKYHLV